MSAVAAEPPSTSHPGAPIRVVLVDDHTLFREGLAKLLERTEMVEIVGQAASGLLALETCSQVAPDLVLLDLIMPGMGGLETVRRLLQSHPDIKVIVLSMHNDPAYVESARNAGARGFVAKDVGVKTLLQALFQVSSGGQAFSPPPAGARQSASKRETLTPRETQILALVVEGFSSREVAARLAISPRTVEAHRRIIGQKIGEKSATGLVRYAVQHGLVVL